MPSTKINLANYYQRRAKEYEKIYDKPERQEALTKLYAYLQARCKSKNVLEIACGTGYWTHCISNTASSIIAADINDSVLEIAQQKDYGSIPVSFRKADAFDLSQLDADFRSIDVLFMAFWWSHILREKFNIFMTHLATQLPANTTLLMVDNLFVEGSNTPISRRDAFGNSFQQRQLEDGSQFEVLKNFPDEEQLHASFSTHCHRGTYIEHQYFWTYETQLK